MLFSGSIKLIRYVSVIWRDLYCTAENLLRSFGCLSQLVKFCFAASGVVTHRPLAGAQHMPGAASLTLLDSPQWVVL
jgi:hypothetical protein